MEMVITVTYITGEDGLLFFSSDTHMDQKKVVIKYVKTLSFYNFPQFFMLEIQV